MSSEWRRTSSLIVSMASVAVWAPSCAASTVEVRSTGRDVSVVQGEKELQVRGERSLETPFELRSEGVIGLAAEGWRARTRAGTELAVRSRRRVELKQGLIVLLSEKPIEVALGRHTLRSKGLAYFEVQPPGGRGSDLLERHGVEAPKEVSFVVALHTGTVCMQAAGAERCEEGPIGLAIAASGAYETFPLRWQAQVGKGPAPCPEGFSDIGEQHGFTLCEPAGRDTEGEAVWRAEPGRLLRTPCPAGTRAHADCCEVPNSKKTRKQYLLVDPHRVQSTNRRLRNGPCMVRVPRGGSGRPLLQASFVDDEPDGRWLQWGADGFFDQIESFHQGRLEGPRVELGPDGFVRSEVHYRGGSKDGLDVEFFGSGLNVSPLRVSRFEAGRRQGLALSWHGNGRRSSACRYRDDALHGTCTHWYESGHLRRRETYGGGDLQGPWTSWYDDGGEKERGRYCHDARCGEWEGFFAAGTKLYQGRFDAGRTDGSWTIWSPSQEIAAKGEMAGGQPVGRWSYDLPGYGRVEVSHGFTFGPPKGRIGADGEQTLLLEPLDFDLERGLVAYRRVYRLVGESPSVDCQYPGMQAHPTAGVQLGVYDLGAQQVMKVFTPYAAARNRERCTAFEAAKRSLGQAKAYLAAQGLSPTAKPAPLVARSSQQAERGRWTIERPGGREVIVERFDADSSSDGFDPLLTVFDPGPDFRVNVLDVRVGRKLLHRRYQPSAARMGSRGAWSMIGAYGDEAQLFIVARHGFQSGDDGASREYVTFSPVLRPGR